MTISQELLKIIKNKRKLLDMAKKETEMAIEHFQLRDMETEDYVSNKLKSFIPLKWKFKNKK